MWAGLGLGMWTPYGGKKSRCKIICTWSIVAPVCQKFTFASVFCEKPHYFFDNVYKCGMNPEKFQSCGL